MPKIKEHSSTPKAEGSRASFEHAPVLKCRKAWGGGPDLSGRTGTVGCPKRGKRGPPNLEVPKLKRREGKGTERVGKGLGGREKKSNQSCAA